MKCPIKGCSEDCKKCDGKSTTWIENGEEKECVYVIVWRSRKKGSKSSLYEPLTTAEKDDVEKSLIEIKEGRAKKFRSVDKFLKELKE